MSMTARLPELIAGADNKPHHTSTARALWSLGGIALLARSNSAVRVVCSGVRCLKLTRKAHATSQSGYLMSCRGYPDHDCSRNTRLDGCGLSLLDHLQRHNRTCCTPDVLRDTAA